MVSIPISYWDPNILLYFHMVSPSPKRNQGLTLPADDVDAITLETCQSTIALALGMVMAGTGADVLFSSQDGKIPMKKC